MKCKNCGYNRFYGRHVYNLKFNENSESVQENLAAYHVCDACHKPHYLTDWTKEERDEG